QAWCGEAGPSAHVLGRPVGAHRGDLALVVVGHEVPHVDGGGVLGVEVRGDLEVEQQVVAADAGVEDLAVDLHRHDGRVELADRGRALVDGAAADGVLAGGVVGVEGHDALQVAGGGGGVVGVGGGADLLGGD